MAHPDDRLWRLHDDDRALLAKFYAMEMAHLRDRPPHPREATADNDWAEAHRIFAHWHGRSLLFGGIRVAELYEGGSSEDPTVRKRMSRSLARLKHLDMVEVEGRERNNTHLTLTLFGLAYGMELARNAGAKGAAAEA
jgi:hypothetical protein